MMRPLIDERVNALCVRLDELIASQQAGVIGWQVCRELAGVERIYAMRKKAVGLLGNAKGAAKPIPFAEDTCVPPEHLADYIAEFRALLDSHGLSYGMFGHVDAGVLHVRPALDMCDPQQEILMKQISDDVVRLPRNTVVCCGANTAKVFAPNTARRFSVRNFLQNCVK
ncbi:putative FAD-binding oxidase [Escherichia coli]|uniref:D-2-hydroxyglutarate dehydrogenase n=1 Tax=Escherichia coli TaxID=562 RepID=A0A376W7M4_ECOLX|nr:putative FAD-binding oxidase [Escherichia coli]